MRKSNKQIQTIDYAEGKRLPFDGLDKIDSAVLECFAYSGGRQLIRCETEEFSAVCPFSGLPDIAAVVLTYIPSKSCVELKSLKYYYLSFRTVGIYQEAVTDRIFKDLKKLLRPRYIRVETIYNIRGGIDTTCVMEEGQNPIS